jgi:hypothetical protein
VSDHRKLCHHLVLPLASGHVRQFLRVRLCPMLRNGRANFVISAISIA